MKPALLGCLAVVAVCGLQACCFQGGDRGASGSATSTFTQPPLTEMEIVDWGPRETQAGVSFNTQASGRAAIWVKVDRPLDGRIVLIQFGDAFLEAHASGNVVSAMVPEGTYGEPGSYEVRVLARSPNARWRSNAAIFKVV